MALPNIASTDESVVDILKQNNTLLAEIVSTLEGQVNVAKNLAEDERIRDENDQFSDIEEASESSSGMLGGGITSAYTGAKAELGNLKGLFPFGGMGAVVGGGILASLIYMFRDSITEFLQENAADALEMLGVGDDLTGKVKDFLSNAAGVGIGASIGKIFGFRGALLGGLLGYIISDYGIGKLFDEDKENDQAVYDNFFNTLKTNPSKVGLELGGLLALLGNWRAGLLVAIGTIVFEKMDLSRLFTDEGRADIMKGVEEEFAKITDGDLGISDAIGVLMGTFLGSKLISGIKGGFASLFARKTAASSMAPAPNQADIDAKLGERTNSVRRFAAQDVLQDMDDADLKKVGLTKTGGGIQRIGGGMPKTNELVGAIDELGKGSEFRQSQFKRLSPPTSTTSPMSRGVMSRLNGLINKLGKANVALTVTTSLISIGMIWSSDLSDDEKRNQTYYYLGGLGTSVIGSIMGGIGGAAAGSLVFAGPGTVIGGFIGMTIGGIGGFFAGETVVKYIVDWLTGDNPALPSPEASNEQEANQLINASALDNILGLPGVGDVGGTASQSPNGSSAMTLPEKLAHRDNLVRARSRTSPQLFPGRLENIDAEILALDAEIAADQAGSNTISQVDMLKGIIPSVDVNQVSDFTRGLKTESASVMIAPTTTIVNNSTNVSSSRGGSRGMPAGAAYNQDQSYMRLQQNVIA